MTVNPFAFWKRLAYLPLFSKIALYPNVQASGAEGSAAVLSAGVGAPTAIAADGSVYFRLDGGLATSLYVRVSGAWVAVTGLAGAAASFASLVVSGTITATGGFIGALTGNADTATKLATASYFTSTEQTGNGSAQAIAHGLGVAPSMWWYAPSDLSSITPPLTFVRGAASTTTVTLTAPAGAKYYIFAIK
jgi:hypothetical protein